MSLGPRPDGKEGDEFSEKLDNISAKIEADFKTCFSERAPNQPGFAEAVILAKTLYERMPAK
jgi:hypothetical protein